MKELKGTQTEKNLLGAFAGESQARNRYTFYSKKARKEGYVQISEIFEQTANHEKAHASTFYKFLKGGEVEITAAFPAGVVGTTLENLLHAAEGERHENTTLYPGFAKVAREEGFEGIAKTFESIAKAEKWHQERYETLAANIKEGTVFKKAETKTWTCRNCGYQHSGPEAPGVCPACMHKQDHFELTAVNY